MTQTDAPDPVEAARKKLGTSLGLWAPAGRALLLSVLPDFEAAIEQRERQRLLSDEVVERAARAMRKLPIWTDDALIPGAWNDLARAAISAALEEKAE